MSADGRVRAFGGAHFHGDLGGRALHRTDRGVGPHAERQGLLARRRRRFGLHVRQRQVLRLDGRSPAQLADRRDEPRRPRGTGYILLGADGGIFTFGNAHFYGSTGNMHLNARVLDLAIDGERQGLLVRGR